jgi:gas vesicle protein
MAAKTADLDDELEKSGRGGAATATALVLAAAAAGLAVGLLVAPDTGEHTRKRLRHSMRSRLDDLSDGLGRGVRSLRHEGSSALRHLEKRLNEVEGRLESARDAAIDAVEEPLERLRGERHTSVAGPLLGLAAGAACAWFLTSDRTAEVRSEMRDAAEKARRRAADEWDRFQQRGGFTRRRTDATAPNGGNAPEPTPPL